MKRTKCPTKRGWMSKDAVGYYVWLRSQHYANAWPIVVLPLAEYRRLRRIERETQQIRDRLAVNAHDALVEVVKRLVALMEERCAENHYAGVEPDYQDLLDLNKARAALALVEEKK
jgi:hypothetical protein